MEIRSVQKSGRMFYLYLPTSWCRKHKVKANAKISLDQDNEGNLIVHPLLRQKEGEHLEITVKDSDIDHLEKVIVACFLHPTASFKIHLDDRIDFNELLKRHELSNMMVIEMEEKAIHGQSSLLSDTPFNLLVTLIRKIKNLLTVLKDGGERSLLERFEEDIDLTKTLIEKAVISAFIQPMTRKDQLRNIDLHYISALSRTLERIVDHIIALPEEDEAFILSLQEMVGYLLPLLDGLHKGSKNLRPEEALGFMQKAKPLIEKSRRSDDYQYRRIGELTDDLSEVLIDWSITEELQKRSEEG